MTDVKDYDLYTYRITSDVLYTSEINKIYIYR